MHCLPGASSRRRRANFKQCKEWHLRRTRLVSVRPPLRVPRTSAARGTTHPDELMGVPAVGGRLIIPNSEFRIPKSRLRSVLQHADERFAAPLIVRLAALAALVVIAASCTEAPDARRPGLCRRDRCLAQPAQSSGSPPTTAG